MFAPTGYIGEKLCNQIRIRFCSVCLSVNCSIMYPMRYEQPLLNKCALKLYWTKIQSKSFEYLEENNMQFIEPNLETTPTF